MSNVQTGILAPVPELARYLSLSLKAGAKLENALRSLGQLFLVSADAER